MGKNTRSVFILVLLLCLLVGGVYWLPSALKGYFFRYEPDYPNPDFVAYYIAGQAFDRGYNPYLDNHAADPTLFDVRPGGFSRFLYPPTLFPFYALLGRLPYKYARAAWLFLNLAMLAGAFLTWVFQARREDRLAFFSIGALLFLTSQPLLFHIQQGQIDMLVAALALFAFAAYRRRRKMLSGFLLSLAVFTKLNPVILLAALFFFHEDWEYLVKFALATLIIFAVSLLAVPFGLYSDFVTIILPQISGSRGFFVNQSLIRLVAYWGEWPRLLSLAGFGGFTLLAWILGRRQRRLSGGDSPYRFADGTDWLEDAVILMNVAVMLLFSGVAWHMAYVWLIIPAARVFGHVYRRTAPAFVGLYGLACILINFTVDEPIYLQSTNLAGGVLLLALLLALVLFPRRILPAPAE